MRKIFALLLILVFMLTGCGSDESSIQTPVSSESSKSNSPENIPGDPASENELMRPDMIVKNLKNKSYETVGQCAYILISKDDLKQISSAQLREFADKRVDGNKYNWISIICDDETGIIFQGSSTLAPVYGYLDIVGCLETQLGSMLYDYDKDTYTYTEYN